jgi:hypothetical protein
MTRSNLVAIASLLAVAVIGGASMAQQPPPQQRPGGPPGAPAAGAPQGQNYPQAGAPMTPFPQTEGAPWPVIMVTSVEVLRSRAGGGVDIIRARGLTTSNAWTHPHLVPITRGEPIDGVLDLLFEANGPSGAVEIGPFMPIEAILPVENGYPYKGVRIRASSNAISLKELPDLPSCLGRRTIARSAWASTSSPRAPTRQPAFRPTASSARRICRGRCASSSRPTASPATRPIPTG